MEGIVTFFFPYIPSTTVRSSALNRIHTEIKGQIPTGDMGSIFKGTTKCHVIAVPYPGRGHVNPMMNICKQLLASSSSTSAGNNIKITFVVTEEWLSFIDSAPPKPANIEFRSIPNVIPSELVRALNFPAFIDAVYTKMEAPFEELLDQLDSPVPVTAIIADTYLPWAVAVGNRRNIPVVSLWTMSASVFSVFYHADLVTQNRDLPINLSECGGELIENIPGISPTRLMDLPTIFYRSGILLDRVLEAFEWVRKAQAVLLTSFHELETHVTDTLKEILPFPVYSVGPSIPYTEIMEIETEHSPSSNNNYYFKWLDSQPKKSVLYVSLGSFLSVSSEQMDEIVFGLLESGVRLFWVARGGDTCRRIQEGCGDMGLVVPWCEQLKVLCHSSVGGFWTHCGFNSTLEGVFAGVPMLTFPIFMDQIPNRKLIVDDLKVGLKVIKKEGTSSTEADHEGGVVKREEIGMIVKRFMDLDESKEMRERASELKETCRRALAKGGSSETNLNAFARDILKCHG